MSDKHDIASRVEVRAIAEPTPRARRARRLDSALPELTAPHPSCRTPLTRADVLSTSEVADLLGIPRSTVHYLARRGELPARRVGRRWLFLRDRLEAAISPLDDPAAWHPQRRI